MSQVFFCSQGLYWKRTVLHAFSRAKTKPQNREVRTKKMSFSKSLNASPSQRVKNLGREENMTRDDVLRIVKEARKKGEIPNLRGSDLSGSDLRGSDLSGSDLDFSCWPLWCGTKGVKVDMKIVRQLLAHVACLNCPDDEYTEIIKVIMPYALKSHRATDLELVNNAPLLFILPDDYPRTRYAHA
jgi:hypothetical protein